MPQRACRNFSAFLKVCRLGFLTTSRRLPLPLAFHSRTVISGSHFRSAFRPGNSTIRRRADAGSFQRIRRAILYTNAALTTRSLPQFAKIERLTPD